MTIKDSQTNKRGVSLALICRQNRVGKPVRKTENAMRNKGQRIFAHTEQSVNRNEKPLSTRIALRINVKRQGEIEKLTDYAGRHGMVLTAAQFFVPFGPGAVERYGEAAG